MAKEKEVTMRGVRVKETRADQIFNIANINVRITVYVCMFTNLNSYN